MKWILLLIVVVSAVVGDLLQSREMKLVAQDQGPVRRTWRLLHLIATRKYLILGIASMAVSFFAFLVLVQTEPLSFAVPASAASFIFETVLAKFALNEQVTARRAIGSILVLGGILLVAR
jgi:drug/metabolite transporter (DMT)-like permease